MKFSFSFEEKIYQGDFDNLNAFPRPVIKIELSDTALINRFGSPIYLLRNDDGIISIPCDESSKSEFLVALAGTVLFVESQL